MGKTSVISTKFMKLGISAAAMLAVSACATVSTNDRAGSTNKAPEFSAERIKADIAFLSDDLLKGRDTGSEGHRVAAKYVAAEFARLGVKPMGDNGTYFQEVPFQNARINKDVSKVAVTVNGETKELAFGDEYLMSGSVRDSKGNAAGDLVFVGYGIHAPEAGHDDYAGLDVKGKVVVLVSGAPSDMNTEVRAHYRSTATKSRAAAELGATGVISVFASEEQRPFTFYKRFIDRDRMDWQTPDGKEVGGKTVGASAAVSHAVAKELFAGAATSFEDALKATLEGNAKPVELKASASLVKDSVLSGEFTSPNVVGVIEGSDPKLKNEYVVISAHLDHIGVSENAEGEDKINNGALDNAAGVSTMLEVARAYANGEKPRRSILFTAVTAEEKGLLGAGYFANFPTVDKPTMVANVNLDMPLILYDFQDVIAFGAERSTLGPITEKAVAEIGLKLSPDPMPEQGLFTRSDHYRFVQQGIPSVFLVTGFETDPSGKVGGEIFRNFLGHEYHSPADQITLDIDYDAGAKFAHVNYLIIKAIANENERPKWNEGDFFGETFGK
ncbi:M28 family metallopeptidase [Kordiimonas laminariae]|uniref:M28 family metallopeptidase n=1 Tax=Kordiimonas laminariae TaxID=2917717 RepID=UPI001FF47D17|nr:M28 family metallopeptidase [Kordiimonas laminariae]MCK0068824.1 M28 family metallopeptidase [Kordiimonas laminariae]